MKSLFDDEIEKEEKPADIQHLFVDEAGDPTLFDSKGYPIEPGGTDTSTASPLDVSP